MKAVTMMEEEEERLKLLAQDPKNKVLYYAPREKLADSEIVPLDQVQDKIQRLFAEYKQKKGKQGLIKKKAWYKIRVALLENPEWKEFDRTHPTIVDQVLAPNVSKKEIDTLLIMIEMKKSGKSIAEFEQIVIDKFAMPKKEFKYKPRFMDDQE